VGALAAGYARLRQGVVYESDEVGVYGESFGGLGDAESSLVPGRLAGGAGFPPRFQF